MKKILLILLVLITPSVHSVSNQDLLDRLDEIEFEREMNREIDRINRETDRRRQGGSQNNGSLRYIVDNIDGTSYYIDTKDITKFKDGDIYFSRYSISDKPRYFGNVVYFHNLDTVVINCQRNEYTVRISSFGDSSGKKIKEVKFPPQYKSISSTSIMDSFRQYLCR